MLQNGNKKLILKITFWLILVIMMILAAFATNVYWIHLPVYTNDSSYLKKKIKMDQYLGRTVANGLNVDTPPMHKYSVLNTSSRLLDLERVNHSVDFLYNKSEAIKLSGHQDLQVSGHSQEESLKQKTNLSDRMKTTHIVFLKVHKSASSTMQNIFFRFGVNHNLNIALPYYDNYFPDTSYQMPIEASQHYDIFACHTIYRKTLFDDLLPADSVKIGIVREPVERMISSAYYYRDVFHDKYLMRVPRVDFIHNLVKYPEKYDFSFFSETRNTMAKDFGFSSNTRQSDVQQIQQYLKELNLEFLLVLTVEKMDESLVLMRRLLHWSISEILYLNVNKHEHETVLLTEYEKAKYRNTSFLDFEVYNYFKKVLDEKLQNETGEFWAEVEYFKSLLKRVIELCSGARKGQRSVVVEESVWNDRFSIQTSDCKWMDIEEMVFIDILRKRHKDMHHLNSRKMSNM